MLASIPLCLLVVWFAQPGSAPAQGSQQASRIQITDLNMKGDSLLLVSYQEGDQIGQLDMPLSVLEGAVKQLQAQGPTASEKSTSMEETSASGKKVRKRGYARLIETRTGRLYDVEIFADSLVRIQYPAEEKRQEVTLPANIIAGIYVAHRALLGRQSQEIVEGFVDLKSGYFSFGTFQQYPLWVAFVLLLFVVFGVILIPSLLYVRKVRRERDELVASRSLQITEREKERIHLAAELHDGPVQVLQRVLSTHLLPLKKRLKEDEHRSVLENMQDMLQHVTGDLRAISTELRPHVLVHLGLDEALLSYLSLFQERNSGIEIEFDLDPENRALPMSMRLALYRIGQEALNNVAKHASARHIQVSFKLEAEEVILAVQDDGCGFTLPKRWIELEQQGHLGLSGIAARVEAIGGSLKVDTKVGRGTMLCVRVPGPGPPNT